MRHNNDPAGDRTQDLRIKRTLNSASFLCHPPKSNRRLGGLLALTGRSSERSSARGLSLSRHLIAHS